MRGAEDYAAAALSATATDRAERSAPSELQTPTAGGQDVTGACIEEAAVNEKQQGKPASSVKPPAALNQAARVAALMQFDLRFLMQGVRLRAVAPDAALLLDTGCFALRVRRGPRSVGGGVDEWGDAVSWTCALDGLSVAATSASSCPGLNTSGEGGSTCGYTLSPSNGLQTHRSPTQFGSTSGAESRVWVLAHAQTNLSIRNGGGPETTSGTDNMADPVVGEAGGGAAANAAEGWWRGGGTRLALTLRQTDAQAHPGSAACLAGLVRHYSAAYSAYAQERRALGLDVDRLDKALSRVVETGRSAAQGHIRRQAPEIIRDLVVNCTKHS